MNNLWPARHVALHALDGQESLISFMFFLSIETGTVPALK
jgi:hypothetical protein